MVVNYTPAPPHRGGPLLRFMLEYNPFYLLSAMCMLAGLFSLNDSLDWSPLPMFNVLMLIVMLNLYELLLIGFGIFLHRRGLRRDATTLLVLEAFFLVDAGFLNSEVFTQNLEVGVIVNLMLFVFAVVKVSAIFRALGLPLRGAGPFALIVAQIALLLAMPGIFKFVSQDRNGALPALALYGVWWCVGGIVALYGMLLRGVNFTPGAPRIERFARHRGAIGALIGLGFVSIVAHLCTSNWVYGVRWYTANLSPVLLGLAVAGACAQHPRMTGLARLRATISLPVLAVMLSAAYPWQLEFQPGGLLVFSPLRLALLGAATVYVHAMIAHRQPLFGVASTGCLLTAGLGYSMPEIAMNIESLGELFGDGFKSVLPKRAVHWGVTSVVVSFLLLLAGVLLSLFKGKLESAELKRYLDDRVERVRPEDGTAVISQ
jgi:hypothetical protein